MAMELIRNTDPLEGIAIQQEEDYSFPCPVCGSDVDVDDFGPAYRCYECKSVVRFSEENIRVDTKDDMCQPCHNALQCLEWARNGYKAKCPQWDYFKQHYASGNKKIVGDETEVGAGE